MVKIKLLIYLLLTCSVANAGLRDKVTVHVNQNTPTAISYPLIPKAERRIPIGKEGWSHCTAKRRSDLGAGEIKCFHESGATVYSFCLVRTIFPPGIETYDRATVILAAKNPKAGTSVVIDCTPTD